MKVLNRVVFQRKEKTLNFLFSLKHLLEKCLSKLNSLSMLTPKMQIVYCKGDRNLLI